ncbi:MAG: hypothetical protein ABUL73_04590 [Alphaproteobacteria bacterium]
MSADPEPHAQRQDSEAPAPNRNGPRELWLMVRQLVIELCQVFGSSRAIARQSAAGRLTGEARALLLTWLRGCEMALRHALLIEAAALMPSLPPKRNAPAAPRKRAGQSTAPSFDPDAPESWRIGFRSIPHTGRCSRRTARARRIWRPRIDPRDAPFPPPDYFIIPEDAARADKAAWLARLNEVSSPVYGGGDREAIGGGGARLGEFCATPTVSRNALDTSPACGGGISALARRAEALLRVFNDPLPAARRLALRLRDAPKRARRALHVPGDIDRVLDRDAVGRLHDAAAAAFNTS